MSKANQITAPMWASKGTDGYRTLSRTAVINSSIVCQGITWQSDSVSRDYCWRAVQLWTCIRFPGYTAQGNQTLMIHLIRSPFELNMQTWYIISFLHHSFLQCKYQLLSWICHFSHRGSRPHFDSRKTYCNGDQICIITADEMSIQSNSQRVWISKEQNPNFTH